MRWHEMNASLQNWLYLLCCRRLPAKVGSSVDLGAAISAIRTVLPFPILCRYINSCGRRGPWEEVNMRLRQRLNKVWYMTILIHRVFSSHPFDYILFLPVHEYTFEIFWYTLMTIIQPFHEWEHPSSRRGTWPMFCMAIPGWWAASMDGCTKRRRPWLRQLKLSSIECASLQVWGCITRTHAHMYITYAHTIAIIWLRVLLSSVFPLPVAVANEGQ